MNCNLLTIEQIIIIRIIIRLNRNKINKQNENSKPLKKSRDDFLQDDIISGAKRQKIIHKNK
jgi:hypothetical protein